MFYIYILRSINHGCYYIGSCENIEERIKQHNAGNVKSTKKFIPWELKYNEGHPTRKEAVQREKKIKSWKSRKAIEKLFKKHF